jgi:hypothetical protein
MAVEKIINLKVNDDIKDTENNVVSLKRQLREAQQDVQNLADKFGATSTQAVEAAKKAAELKDRIGDAKNLTDAYNPDAKFKALTGALSGAAGAGAAFAGTMGLVGVESKDVEQALLKVQSAMAISQGLQAVGESIDQFKILKTVIFGSTAAKTADTVATEANNASQSKNILGRGIQIVQTGIQTALTAGLTAATWLFNAAMAANPIGAIVAVIALLIASGYALINMFMANSAAAKKNELANKALANEIKNNKKEQDKANETFQEARDHQLGMAKASGKSAEEIRKLTLALAKQELQQNLTNYETNRATALEAKRRAGLEGATDAQKKTAEEAVKLNNESVKAVNQSKKDIRKIESENEIARKQEQTDGIKKSLENQKKGGEDAKAKRKEQLSALENLEKKYAEDIENLGNKTEAEKLETEKQRALKELDLIKLTDAEKAKAKELLLKDFQIKEQALATSHADKLLALTNKLEDDKNALLIKTDEEKLKITQQKAMKQLEVDLANINASEQEIQNAKIKLRETFALQDAELEKVKIAKEDAQWLRTQEITLEKSEYDKIVLAQKYEAEYAAASGNVELQTELKKNLEKNIKIIDDKAAEDKKVTEQALLNAKLAFAQQGLSLVAEIAGKGSKVGKAVAVAQATISGIEGVQNAYTTAQKSPITIGFPAYPYVQAGLAGVFSALQIRKILSTNAGGSTSAASAGGGGAAAAAPSFNIVGQNSNNQLAQTIAGQQQQPVQAYVVSGNVSSAQSLDRNRIDTATFN